jgi:hypothetical protein
MPTKIVLGVLVGNCKVALPNLSLSTITDLWLFHNDGHVLNDCPLLVYHFTLHGRTHFKNA